MAIRFVIDEDMHRSVAQALTDLEYQPIDIRDHGLRGKPDDAIFRFAQRRQAVLLSADLGFGNTLRFPLGSHHGIVIVRFPNELSTDRINAELKKSLRGLTDKDFKRNLIVVSPGKVRMRRHK
jgi:predicted nuclease of predicted toxin-antitoxin system